ncbi:MAG: type II toxin-antitoxin system MqsA family antitoxin [Deltaproteobacteria bacterium]|nr:type II toxin-antitoxin system MqsA family antitoxin [Deltaproteobacteria bacterium]
MNCVICKQGDTAPGKVTVTLQRGETTIVFKDVPAEVCQNCGEFYLSETVTEKLLSRAEAAVKNGAELEILRYAA